MAVPRKPSLRHVLGVNIRRERTVRAWAQEELAHQAKLSQTYISQVESGKRAVSVDAVERIAIAFGLEPELLFRKT